jgi:hypothetical protein
MSARATWPTVVAASAFLAAAVVVADASTPLRAAVVAWFAFVIPGGAFVPLLHMRDRLGELMLYVAVSLALDLGTACALLYAGAWSPTGGVLLLAALALAGAGLQARSYGTTASPHDDASAPDAPQAPAS